MSKRFKGITVEIGGNTKPLEKALNDVDKASGRTTRELSEINRALKFDSGNTTLLAQKFEVLQNAIQDTSGRLDVLRSSQAEVERAFNAGEISPAAYREFQREIEKTEGILRGFRRQAAEIDARINVQADTSGVNRMRSELRGLASEAKRVGKEIGTHLATGAAAGLAALTGVTLGMSDTNKQLARLETQAATAVSNAKKIANTSKQTQDAETKAFSGANKERENALRKSLDNQMRAYTKSYEEKERALDKSLEKEMKAFENAHDEKIKLIDKEFEERLKLVDQEEYARLKAIDDQIAAIEEQQEAIDRANKAEQEGIRRAELLRKIQNAVYGEDRLAAEQDLADFDKQLMEERAREERKVQIETLKSQKDSIKDAFDENRDKIESERDLKIEQVEETFEIERDKLKELHEQKKLDFNEQKELAIRNLEEQHEADLEKFTSAHDAKVSYAKSNPIYTPIEIDVQATGAQLKTEDFFNSRVIFESIGKDTDQAVESIGNLLQAGYQTEEQLTGISKNLAGATVRYGDAFSIEGIAESIGTTIHLGEATGQLTDLLEKQGWTVEDFNEQLNQYATVSERANFITDLLAKEGLASTYDEYAKLNPEILGAAEAQIRLTDALSELTTALQPLITAVVQIITKFAEWAGNNPALAQAVFVVLGAITAISGVLLALSPILSAISGLWGVLIKVLPFVKLALGALTGPVGLIIGAIAALIAIIVVIIKNWDVFKEAIVKVGSVIKDSLIKSFEFMSNKIKGIFTGLADVIKGVWNGIVDSIKGAINFIIRGINTFIGGINKVKIPDWVPKVGGKGINIPEIPMLAKGTDYFRGGMAIVGENGAELVTMPSGAKVHNNKDTMEMLAGGGGFSINIQEMHVRNDNDIKLLARELYAYQEKFKRGK